MLSSLNVSIAGVVCWSSSASVGVSSGALEMVDVTFGLTNLHRHIFPSVGYMIVDP